MSKPTGGENRKHPRFEAVIPIRFNLNPDHHYVPRIRNHGIAGALQNISHQGIMIDSRMDLLDLFQIFHEEMEGNSCFELEVVVPDFAGKRLLVRGATRWYRLGEPKGEIRQFQAGLYLKDTESQVIARGILESLSLTATCPFGPNGVSKM
jgi:hypothetical protein